MPSSMEDCEKSDLRGFSDNYFHRILKSLHLQVIIFVKLDFEFIFQILHKRDNIQAAGHALRQAEVIDELDKTGIRCI